MTVEDTEPICERCIWNLDHEGLARTGPCDRFSWAGSVQRELLEHSVKPDLSGETGPFPAHDRCAAITMVKDEADIIQANLAWLHHIGVRRFLILDNLSTDSTPDQIARFQARRPDAGVAVVRDPIVAHYQADKMTWLAQKAQSLWPEIEWLLPVDADEFLIARHGLKALAFVPDAVHAMTIPKTVHFLQAGIRPRSKNVLARMPVRSELFVVPPKVILRARPYLGLTQGNHKARSADRRRIQYTGGFQYGFYYRKFQTRSFEHFLRKVRNGGTAILAARAEGREVGGEHWMAWFDILATEGEPALRAVFERDCFRRPDAQYVCDPFVGAAE